MREKAKILLVDDRKANLIALERSLKGIEAECFHAISGNNALALTLEHEFALALIDVQMPDMDGFETVRLMRSDSKTELLPIIFISAIYSDEFYLIKGIESGAVDFLIKPVNTKILKGKTTIFLKMYQQRKELEEALNKVEILHGLLPICSFCKSIRDDQGYWSQIDEYIAKHSDVDFSHSICPDCMKKYYPEVLLKRAPPPD
jgi:DNA-binding response OmpR family regulator